MGTNYICNKNMLNRKALLYVSGTAAGYNISVSMGNSLSRDMTFLVNLITSNFQTSGTIQSGYDR